VQMGFVNYLNAFGRKGLGQLLCDDIPRRHGPG
jgi:hypothetical protein